MHWSTEHIFRSIKSFSRSKPCFRSLETSNSGWWQSSLPTLSLPFVPIIISLNLTHHSLPWVVFLLISSLECTKSSDSLLVRLYRFVDILFCQISRSLDALSPSILYPCHSFRLLASSTPSLTISETPHPSGPLSVLYHLHRIPLDPELSSSFMCSLESLHI